MPGTAPFTFAATKRLSTVDVSPDASNQHEIGGAGRLRRHLLEAGAISDDAHQRIDATLTVLRDDDEPLPLWQSLTFSDAGSGEQPDWRLCYPSWSPFHGLVAEGAVDAGDLLVIAVTAGGSLQVMVAAAGSQWERVLLGLFPRPAGQELWSVDAESLAEHANRSDIDLLLGFLGIAPLLHPGEEAWLLAQPEVVEAAREGAMPSPGRLADLAWRRVSDAAEAPDPSG